VGDAAGMKALAAALVQWSRQTAWAPVLVLLIHQIVLRTPWRRELDFWMHFSGGLAAAYLAWHGLVCFERWLGRVTHAGRCLFSFGLACTIGVFWEFAELASDVFRGTHIQHSIHETMRDLIADACGATLTLILTDSFARKQRPAG